MMKKWLLPAILAMGMVFAVSLSAQNEAKQKDVKPRPSQKAAVTQRIGIDTDITISYSRPRVRGRAIWGNLVPYGLAKGDSYSNMEPYPWRGGANECTTIEFSWDVRVNGMKLAAGKYSLHFIPSQKTWTVIFNRNNTLWGSYKYKESEDALRIKVTPVKAPHQEWLQYGFDDINDYGATAYLHWADLKVPFKISCEPVFRDGVKASQLESPSK